MKFRKKSTFVSFGVAATATVLMPMDQQICFTHGFHSVVDMSTRTKRTFLTFHARTIPNHRSSVILSSANNAYGRGAEIWPESNNEAIQLNDSFPNGIVPLAASAAMEESDKVDDTTEKERRPRRYIRRILKRAARKDKSFSRDDSSSGLADKIPVIVALLLLVRGMARPADAALVASFTAYFTILNMTAESLRDSGAPILPAVPPQGHSPTILSNPLGLEKSILYGRWLKLGVLMGLIGPLVWLCSSSKLPLEALRLVGRPLFLLCCQMATERTAKQNQVPLPLRVLIPVVYNASRLIYMWQWAFASAVLSPGRIGRALGIMNAGYLAINLFAFLIPIASVRYMRAHFFGVEAEEVKTRIGLEETLGIFPNNNS